VDAHQLRQLRELRAQNERLRERDRTKDLLLALVGEELLVPLTTLKASAGLLQEALGDRDQGREVARLMRSVAAACGQVEALLQELLEFSRARATLPAFERHEVSPALLLTQVVGELSAAARSRGVVLELDLQERASIEADPERLREALTCALRAALAQGQAGSTVEVRVLPSEAEVRVEFSLADSPGARELPRLVAADPFSAWVLARGGEDTALALAVARHVAAEHGGRLEVHSNPEGTTLKLVLPRTRPASPLLLEELAGSPAQVPASLAELPEGADEGLLSFLHDLLSRYEAEKLRSQRLEETNRELERTFLEVVGAMVRMLDLHNAYTGPHSDRVAFYATCMARRLDPSLLQRKDFLYSLLLHDIGKIGLADSLLQKAGRLSEEELSRLRSHPEIGAQILESVRFLQPAIASVRHHHERWDGRGYPDGLAGSEIPLPARIIAVADAFDAMTSDRPYRKRLSLEEARQELERNAGRQFDPEVVGAFLQAWDEILEYCQKVRA
jgi:HD-GYP domain-containing protein (c-di-GMP phosphodiesterase class II)